MAAHIQPFPFVSAIDRPQPASTDEFHAITSDKFVIGIVLLLVAAFGLVFFAQHLEHGSKALRDAMTQPW